MGRPEYWQQDNRNLQLANNNHAIAVHWTALTTDQQQAFIHTMSACLTTLANGRIFYFLLYRDGAYRRSDEEQISLEIAELYVTHMQRWLEHQREVWQNELTQYGEAQPAVVFRRVMDATIEAQDRRSFELAAAIEEQEARTRAIIEQQVRLDGEIAEAAARQEEQQRRERVLSARIGELERRERELLAHDQGGPPPGPSQAMHGADQCRRTIACACASYS